MLYSEVIAICSQNHTKYIKALKRKSFVLLNVTNLK